MSASGEGRACAPATRGRTYSLARARPSTGPTASATSRPEQHCPDANGATGQSSRGLQPPHLPHRPHRGGLYRHLESLATRGRRSPTPHSSSPPSARGSPNRDDRAATKYARPSTPRAAASSSGTPTRSTSTRGSSCQCAGHSCSLCAGSESRRSGEGGLISHSRLRADLPRDLFFLGSRIAFLSAEENDVSPLLRLLVQLSGFYADLKAGHFLNTREIYSTIAALDFQDLEFVSELRISLTLVIAQHFCSRLSRDNALRTKIKHGVAVLYHYYYMHVCDGGEESAIVRSLNSKSVAKIRINAKHQRIDADDRETDEERHELDSIVEAVLTTFRIVYPDRREPTTILKVPWTECLRHVREKNVFLRDGVAYLTYLHVAGWASQRWRSDFKHWVEHDHAVAEEWWQRHEFEKPEALVYALMRGCFFSKEDRERDPELEHRMKRVYESAFAFGRSLDVQLTSSLSSSTPQSVQVALNSFEDYEKIMPPCVHKLYSQHLEKGTHLKNSERLMFVSWCINMNIAWPLVEKAWLAMCTKDVRVDERKLTELKRELQSIHTRFTASPGRFNGCESIASYCPFVDIEDLGVRKELCVNVICDKESDWRKHTHRWSPMSASIYRLKRYSR